MITALASAVRSLAVVTLLALVVFAVSCAGSTTSTSVPATSTGGAAGDWPVYHHDSARTGASSDQGALGQVKEAWTSAQLPISWVLSETAMTRVFITTMQAPMSAMSEMAHAALLTAWINEIWPAKSPPCMTANPGTRASIWLAASYV
jgi:hypothetical protein